jgi:hypothetical protein
MGMRQVLGTLGAFLNSVAAGQPSTSRPSIRYSRDAATGALSVVTAGDLPLKQVGLSESGRVGVGLRPAAVSAMGAPRSLRGGGWRAYGGRRACGKP